MLVAFMDVLRRVKAAQKKNYAPASLLAPHHIVDTIYVPLCVSPLNNL